MLDIYSMQQIAIVGAGFTGSMTAVNLVRESNLPFKLLMIDKKQKFNRGTAYDSYSSLHLLNVRASNMSAFPDDPEHFVNWLKNSKGYCRFEKSILGHFSYQEIFMVNILNPFGRIH